MKCKIGTFIHITICLYFLTLTGCAVALIGVGAGAGTLAYVNGKLKKTYNSEYHAAIKACEDTLKALRIPTIGKLSDELKTTINAKRPDETPVTIEVVRIEPYLTEVSVRTGTVGFWDRSVSAQIQGFIDKKLIRGPGDDAALPGANLSDQDVEPPIDKIVVKNDSGEKAGDSASQKTLAAGSAAGDQNTGRVLSKTAGAAPDSDFIIYFDKDSTELSQTAWQKLDRVAGIAARSPENSITLHGYTDAIGAASYNKMVSESRATTVKIYLLGKGVEAARIKTVGHGADKTKAGDETEEARRLKRRVEIEFSKP